MGLVLVIHVKNNYLPPFLILGILILDALEDVGEVEHVEEVEAVLSLVVSIATFFNDVGDALMGSSQIRPDEPGLRNDTVDLCKDDAFMIVSF